MQDTWYLHEAAAPRSRIASLYLGKVGAWTRIWTADQPFYPFAWGSQSLCSTPADYARFLAMLLDKGTADGRPAGLGSVADERVGRQPARDP